MALLVSASCSSKPADAPSPAAITPTDAQHAAITTPHGDHSPHHGGMVMMNGDLHYEVLLDRGGQHRVWFSDAVREELPASMASKVVMTVTRPGTAAETIALRIDDSGESWVAKGRAVAGTDVMVRLTYLLRNEPFEIDMPFANRP